MRYDLTQEEHAPRSGENRHSELHLNKPLFNSLPRPFHNRKSLCKLHFILILMTTRYGLMFARQ